MEIEDGREMTPAGSVLPDYRFWGKIALRYKGGQR
jgi:hypothetical protein